MQNNNRNKKKDLKKIKSVDKIIHEPARLNIMAHLYVIESADFLFIMHQTDLTFGNLSAHMTKLEEAGYIKIKKEFIGKKPHTILKLTKKGRDAFDNYRTQMKLFFNEI